MTAGDYAELIGGFAAGAAFMQGLDTWTNLILTHLEEKAKRGYNATRKRIALLELATDVGYSQDSLEWIKKQRMLTNGYSIQPNCIFCSLPALYKYPSSASPEWHNNYDSELRRRLCYKHIKGVKK